LSWNRIRASFSKRIKEDLASQRGLVGLRATIWLLASGRSPVGDDQEPDESRQVLYEFARRCLDEQVVKVDVTELEDGSVLLGSPKITEPKKFFDLLLK
jgi:hypothetical protein